MEPLLSNSSSNPLQLEEKRRCPGSHGYQLMKKHVYRIKRRKAWHKEQFRTVKTVRKIAKQKHTTLPVELHLAQESYKYLLQSQDQAVEGKLAVTV